MLKAIQDTKAIILCPNCNNETEHDLAGKRAVFLEEFGEYENIYFQCPFCPTVKAINMNIPINDTDENFASGDLPVEEEIQRYYVRILQRLVREDLAPGPAEI
jgi:hypothetical protein